MNVTIITAILSWVLVLAVAACGTSETQINWNDPIAEGATLTYADARDMVTEAGPYKFVDDKGYASEDFFRHSEVANRWFERCMSNLSESHPDLHMRCASVWTSVAYHLFPEIVTASVGTVECPDEKIDLKAIGDARDEQVGMNNVDLTIGDAIEIAQKAGNFNHSEGNSMTLEWRDKHEQFQTAQAEWFDVCQAAYPPGSSSASFQCTTAWLGAYWYAYPEQYDKYHLLHCSGPKSP